MGMTRKEVEAMLGPPDLGTGSSSHTVLLWRIKGDSIKVEYDGVPWENDLRMRFASITGHGSGKCDRIPRLSLVELAQACA